MALSYKSSGRIKGRVFLQGANINFTEITLIYWYSVIHFW